MQILRFYLVGHHYYSIQNIKQQFTNSGSVVFNSERRHSEAEKFFGSEAISET